MLKNIVIISLLLIIGYLVGKDKILSLMDKAWFMIGNTIVRAKSKLPEKKELTGGNIDDVQSDIVNDKVD